jgi:hypothetical protein
MGDKSDEVKKIGKLFLLLQWIVLVNLEKVNIPCIPLAWKPLAEFLVC